MTEAARAVFVSYASQDVEPAQRICAALRAAGIEVWFDQSELRGGDAWDQKIRRELQECALFIPVISANTVARPEGYFRLEWDLADQRTHMMARNRAFVVPVCVDMTAEASGDTPESFRRVHWTRLPSGTTSDRFVAHIKQLLAPTGALVAASGPAGGGAVEAELPAAPVPGRWRSGWILAALAAAAALVLGYLELERPWGSAPSARRAESIAVLPLANESGDADQQYFSDGISQDLITALSQFPGLKVIGRTSAFSFRDSKEDSRSIGAKLGVAHLLEGSVRRSGGVVRVSAELIDTTDGSTQWSASYDRPYQDLFALQDEITRAVAGALRAKLVAGEHGTAQSERPPGGSLEAYRALLQGRFYALRHTDSDLRKAIEYYSQAIRLDPRYALAWSGLSQAWNSLGVNFSEGAETQQAYARARESAERALALSPELAAAHVARGLIQNVDLDWHGAEAEFRRALALAPSDGETRFFMGQQLAILGEVESAVELTREALATDPLQPNWYNWLSIYLAGLNRVDEAKQAIHRAIDLQPIAQGFFLQLTIVEIQRGNAQAALAAAQREPFQVAKDNALTLARQIGSGRSEGDAALRALIEKYAGVGNFQIAEVYALRGESNATFEWLDRAWSARDPYLKFLLIDSFILRYRDDPRFAAFCRKVGLPTPQASPASKSQ